MKKFLATAFAAAAFAASAQAQSVSSACRAQGQALGYATGDRYLGQRYDRDCQVLTPLPRTTTVTPSPDLRSLEEARRRREAALPAPTTKSGGDSNLPSGKAADFDSAIPRFESWRPSQQSSPNSSYLAPSLFFAVSAF